MNHQHKSLRYMVEAGLIAALYAALTYLCSGLAYGQVQFRFSEALTILPVFTPAAIPGLTVGCLIANLGSVYGIVDILCGPLATLLAALCTRAVRHIRIKNIPWLAPVFPVLWNALIIGLEISFFLPEALTFAGFGAAALSVGGGELLMCFGLGLPLAYALNKIKLFHS